MEKRKYYRYEPNDRGIFRLKEKIVFGAQKNCFLTKEEATAHFVRAEKIAVDKSEK